MEERKIPIMSEKNGQEVKVFKVYDILAKDSSIFYVGAIVSFLKIVGDNKV